MKIDTHAELFQRHKALRSTNDVSPFAWIALICLRGGSSSSALAAAGLGVIGAWSPTGAPNMNGAPWTAPSACADEGGTAVGLTDADEEDAERSGELPCVVRLRLTSWANLTLILGLAF